MTAPTNHWKLGLFVIVSFALAVLAMIFVGSQALQKDVVTYVSYFDEAVTGLQIGSPVSFRGVKIGSVSDVTVAPDRRHVEVHLQLDIELLTRLGLARQRDGKPISIAVPQDMRVQLSSAGITGSKYIDLDFFAKDEPLVELPFERPWNYIPAEPSTMKNLEESIVRAADALPQIASQLAQVMKELEVLVGDVNDQQLPQRVTSVLTAANQAFATLDRQIAALDTAGLSQKSNQTLARIDGALARADALLARMDGERGLLASVQRASDSIGDVAANARGTGGELDQTLTELREVANSVQRFVEALERDSDMLLKGRAGGVP
jgi:paraquat-inducible protein B